MSAYAKEIVRAIQTSLGRFLAIVGITALGCGFFAGLQMSGRDMRLAADAYYDATQLYDIRVVSTLGFTEEDIARVAAIEGVGEIMPSHTFDAMADFTSESYAVRVSTINIALAKASSFEQAPSVTQNASYLNRVSLVEGRWPRSQAECVLSADRRIADGFELGDTVQLSSATVELKDTLRGSRFTVVGLVSSPNYPYTGSFGSTNLGSGSIEQYMFVGTDALADDVPYTELYISVPHASSFISESDEYFAYVDTVSEKIEASNAELAEARVVNVRKKAQEELDEKRKEYQEERLDAEAELNQAEEELNEAAKKISDAELELVEGQANYDQGLKDLEQSKQDLQSARTKLDDSKKEIEDAEKELAAGEKQWESSRKKLMRELGLADNTSLAKARKKVEGDLSSIEDARAQVDEGLAKVEAAITDAQAAIPQLEQGITDTQAGYDQAVQAKSQVDAEIAALEEKIAHEEATQEEKQQLSDLKKQAADLDKQISSLTETLRSLTTQLEASKTGLAQAVASKDELEAAKTQLPPKSTSDALNKALSGIEQLESSKSELESSKKEIEDAKKKLEDGEQEYKDGEQRIADAENQLAAAKKSIDDGVRELADARNSYMEGRATFAAEKSDVLAKFDEAEQQLNDAQTKIDEIERPDIYVLDRSKSEGAVTYHDDSLRIDRIANVFPTIFFLVAALVSLTTMTRMVEDDRIEIGTHKALGYSTMAIAGKYLAYAGIASFAGACIGITVLTQILPYIIINSYAIIYAVPLLRVPLPVDPAIVLLSGGLGVGITLVATAAAVLSSLKEVPATLMLPKAPAQGKRIILEELAVVWSRLSFSWKVTARNLFRYKKRLTMTVIGIAGCTALLLTGFGLHDAIWDIIDKQFGPIVHYDTIIGLDDDAIETDVIRVCDYLTASGEAPIVTRVHMENMQAAATDSLNSAPVKVIVPKEVSQFTNSISLRNRTNKNRIILSDTDAVITEKLSLLYNIHEGDYITIYEQDEVGNAVGDGTRIRVSGIAENYVGNSIYVGHATWEKIGGTSPVFSTLLVSITDNSAVREKMATDLRSMRVVSTISFADETIEMYHNMLSVVDLIVVVLIVSAAALAAIVLYNLTNINITERIREIASLKVLGFTKREVYAYIFREVLILSLLGALVGLGLGVFLARFVIETAEVDYVMFGREIHPASYVYAFALTIVFAVAVLVVMRHKLDEVDMVESLKSVD